MNFIPKVLFMMFLFFGGVVQAENFPLLRGKIVDEIGVLSYSQRNELQKHLSSIPTFVVAIVHQPFGMGIEEYSKRLFNHWGLNKSEKQDGILMLYVPQKGEYKIEVGAGLKNILTDEVLEDIIQKYMTLKLKNNGYALVDGARVISLILSGQKPPLKIIRIDGQPIEIKEFMILKFVIALIVLFALYEKVFRWLKQVCVMQTGDENFKFKVKDFFKFQFLMTLIFVIVGLGVFLFEDLFFGTVFFIVSVVFSLFILVFEVNNICLAKNYGKRVYKKCKSARCDNLCENRYSRDRFFLRRSLNNENPVDKR